MAFVSPFQVCYFSLSLIAVSVFVGFTCIYAWFTYFDSCSHNFSRLLCPALSIYKRGVEKRCKAKSFAGRTLYPTVPLVENSQCLHFSCVYSRLLGDEGCDDTFECQLWKCPGWFSFQEPCTRMFGCLLSLCFLFFHTCVFSSSFLLFLG